MFLPRKVSGRPTVREEGIDKAIKYGTWCWQMGKRQHTHSSLNRVLPRSSSASPA
ncbi:hypothetical protein GLOTRDRAFT_111853 [Gloeophyllum trabeum ATCC 11539]|uniref:Uncharacterized protein n=1 Tax=Gloeophyllum trabeum (strain ATCC 11539 / FP-39264 / Madison 617) TaxID=670483 RepID=S7RFX5_GLOTA|nr:uncharacterized protein GLOTRDRAFT_111853 [Gloeophyllum trabeum ATCC 11539]EPQ53100.1 hypothetical protein GLOTRDRAFT_111853 [Gloeophyllum trabeum ATCC 11539]